MPIATPFDVGKLARLALHSGAQGARPEEVLLLRTAWKISFSTSSCMRTKCSGRTAMSWASRGTVRRNGRHGQPSFCWRTSSIASVPSTTKKEGVVSLYRKTRKKKVFVHGLLQRAPRLVGCSLLGLVAKELLQERA